MHLAENGMQVGEWGTGLHVRSHDWLRVHLELGEEMTRDGLRGCSCVDRELGHARLRVTNHS